MFGLTLFRPGRQSNPSRPCRSHVGRRKIQISPPTGEQDWSNALPQGQQRQSNPFPMPFLSPPSPAPHRFYVDRYIKEMKKEMKKTICAPPPPLQSKFNCLMFHSVSLHLDNETLGLGRVRVSCIAGFRKGREREFGWVTSRALSASHAPKITFSFRFEHLPSRLG